MLRFNHKQIISNPVCGIENSFNRVFVTAVENNGLTS